MEIFGSIQTKLSISIYYMQDLHFKEAFHVIKTLNNEIEKLEVFIKLIKEGLSRPNQSQGMFAKIMNYKISIILFIFIVLYFYKIMYKKLHNEANRKNV